ncbi:MAG TPA: ArgE/DapE family deacylase [Candidatus Sulfotelmatobacter sp.]|nr:ArgE/DapE family deacylase [Candidatus Sulfotelmatobacter sp.]
MTDRAPLAAWLTACLGDLIALPSPVPPGDTTRICAYAAERLARAGYRTETARRAPGVDNVVASLGQGAPYLVFNAHVDTVGVGERALWRTDPFQATVRDGLVIGLGAGNCKGSMAAQLWLAEEIARAGGPRRGTVSFTFVGDEETLGPDGMAFLRESGRVRPDMLVLGAQTENQLITAERGVLWVAIETRGRAAHAGAPEQGDNAILRMLRVLAHLERALAPRLATRRDGAMASTINLGMIRGGHNTNVVPSACRAEIDRRLLPGETVDAAFDEIAALVAAVGEPADRIAIERLRGTNGFRAPADGALVQAFSAAIAAEIGAPARFLNATGVSDGRYFADDGIEIVNFGPGAGAQGHAANESVPIDQIVQAALIQRDLVARLLGLGADGA